MVGSVLIQRMIAENDFSHCEPVFFSTSNAGGDGPKIGGIETGKLHSASAIETLAKMDVVITCQGGDYTSEVFPKLRALGWSGYWIDAASTLRMNDDAIIILDPVNEQVIRDGIASGINSQSNAGGFKVTLALESPGSVWRIPPSVSISAGPCISSAIQRVALPQASTSPPSALKIRIFASATLDGSSKIN